MSVGVLHATQRGSLKVSTRVTAEFVYDRKSSGGKSLFHTVDLDAKGEFDLKQSDRESETLKEQREKKLARSKRNL